MNKEKRVEKVLRVEEAKSRDVGRGIARIDSSIAKELGLVPGDVVMIDGKKSTACIYWPGYAEDAEKEIIRIDGITRRNAGVGIDDKVKVRKAQAKTANKVVFSPTEELRIVGMDAYLSHIMEGRVVTKGDVITLNIMGRRLDMVITSISPPAEAVIIGASTEIKVSEKVAKEEAKIPRITYEDIGGLEEEIKQVREMIELPLKHPELFERLGIEAPKGVLLHGPPGTGKTLLAKAVANETNANFYSLSGPEIMSKYYGESEENLRKIFNEAIENAPSIIFIDEIDSIAPKREEVHGEVERRVVSQLLTLLDGLKGRGKIIVIGATNRPDSLDPALRRPGRLDREIEIGVPDRKGRKEILQIHTRGMPLAKDVNIDELADVTHGFVGADLAALAREAAMSALRRYLPKIDLDKPIPTEILKEMMVKMDDFKEALKSVEPSALREVMVEIPRVKWEDVGGLHEVKQRLIEAAEWPLKNPKVFKRIGIRPPKGILLYGPPGTGKTLLAKAVATESQANFLSIKGPEIFSKWVGESEKAIRELFKKAKQTAPSIIFLDELDSLAPRRGSYEGSRVTETVVNQLLTSIDGLEQLRDIVVIGATNRPDIIDSSLLRPGRFDELIFVGPPDKEARMEIFKIHTSKMPLAKDVSIEELADLTEGYVGADIEGICREAGMMALRENIDAKEVKREHFMKAMENVHPSIDEEMLDYYMEVEKKLGKGLQRREIRKGIEVM